MRRWVLSGLVAALVIGCGIALSTQPQTTTNVSLAIATSTFGPCVTPSVLYSEANGSQWATRCGPVGHSVIAWYEDERKVTPNPPQLTPRPPNFAFCGENLRKLDVAEPDLHAWGCNQPGPTPIDGDEYVNFNGNPLYQFGPTPTALPTVTP